MRRDHPAYPMIEALKRRPEVQAMLREQRAERLRRITNALKVFALTLLNLVLGRLLWLLWR